MAFDCTYLTTTLCQMKIEDQTALVGGIYMPQGEDSSFVPLDHDLKVSSIPRASTMLERVSWCPSLKRKLPLSVVSVPVQHNFAGAGGALRGCFYMAEVMGKVLLHSNGIIRSVFFDAHGSHALIRRLLHGELHGLNMDDVRVLPFFGDLKYEPAPEHGLPRFPIAICKFQDEIIHGLGGVCYLTTMFLFRVGWGSHGSHFVVPSEHVLPPQRI